MIATIYKRALAVLWKKPLSLWGISLLEILLIGIGFVLSGSVPGVAICIAILLHTAMTLIYLQGYHGEQVTVIQLFDCFRDFATMKRVLGGMLWMLLWVFLWALIPIVGPIFALIRLYEYRLTPYILVTEPEISATEAIQVSKERTQGYKLKMWGAEVLVVVVLILSNLVLSVLGMIPLIGFLFRLVQFVFVLCAVAFSPLYLGLIRAAFYEEIKNPTCVVPALPDGYDVNATGICPNCGTPLTPESKFCPNCGTKLE